MSSKDAVASKERKCQEKKNGRKKKLNNLTDELDMSLQQIHLFRGWSTALCRVYSRMKNHLRGRPLLECIHDDFWAAKEPGLNVKWGKTNTGK